MEALRSELVKHAATNQEIAEQNKALAVDLERQSSQSQRFIVEDERLRTEVQVLMSQLQRAQRARQTAEQELSAVRAEQNALVETSAHNLVEKEKWVAKL